ncbi:TPM domain-containing protein [Pseudoduganella sp. RAF19]|uniref:TPM domain-containing protein n=1 Tax=Pseudoduganella sp. RAF19 TaxID=3233052 RepID=UPI003F993226
MGAMPNTMTGRIRRALRHTFTSTSLGKRAFPPDTLKAIQQAITQGEQRHRAEVRLIVEAALSASHAFHNLANRERARMLFAQYGVWDTEENCGVLIYVNIAERAVDIVADRHVGRLIADTEWQTICSTMTQGFAQGEFHNSTLSALEQLNTLLARHYPAGGSRPNQLPDEAVIL